MNFSRFWIGAASACVLCLTPAFASADGPDADVPIGFPITAPDYEPEITGQDQPPVHASPTLLYANFDGAQLQSGCGNDSHNNCSTLAGAFAGEILPFTGSDGDKAAIVQATREDVLDFGVIVLGERPPDTQPWAMVLVGDAVNGGVAEHGFAGVAPGINCGNTNPNITSFALELGGINSMATVIHQEAAHTWGLEHINDPTDNLHPVAGGFTDPKYNDTCSKIVADTDLNPSNGQCNNVHTLFCNSGNQNSYQEMLWLFGPPIVDNTAPTVVIEAPTEGEELPCPASFDLIVTLDDDRRPATLSTSISLDGDEVAGGAFINTTLKFPINGGVTPGPHTWHIAVTDESGNPAEAEVNFSIATNPEDPTCSMVASTTSVGTETGGGTETGATGLTVGGTGTTGDGGGEGCACTTSRAPAPWSLFALVPLLAIRRRRSLRV